MNKICKLLQLQEILTSNLAKKDTANVALNYDSTARSGIENDYPCLTLRLSYDSCHMINLRPSFLLSKAECF